MEQEKISSSDTSTAESDRKTRPEKPNDGGCAALRSYDCSFCKRGFTNAQALGGHMNIHRKDKAKAKKAKHRGEEDRLIRSFDSSFFPQAYTPPTNPRGNYEYCFFPVWRPDNLQERIDGSLSSRLDEDDDDEEVDLELRLGRVF